MVRHRCCDDERAGTTSRTCSRKEEGADEEDRKEEVEAMKERIYIWLAWHMPRRLVYWCAIRLASRATMPPYEKQVVPELKVMDALNRWHWT